jgi:sulfur carrier protein
MQVVANGALREVRPGWTVTDLIASLGLDGRFVIVELNGEPLPRSGYGETRLADGDRIELVRAVAGG